ncbi:MAG: hypothetical protein EOM59_13460 [Clostridia bacterium]|nr:hypothetical protein [Clostridia bacterium]
MNDLEVNVSSVVADAEMRIRTVDKAIEYIATKSSMHDSQSEKVAAIDLLSDLYDVRSYLSSVIIADNGTK